MSVEHLTIDLLVIGSSPVAAKTFNFNWISWAEEFQQYIAFNNMVQWCFSGTVLQFPSTTIRQMDQGL